MTAGTVVLLIIAAGIALAAFVPGHWAGRRSRRHDYPDGWDAGREAERAWWEKATGTTRETWQARRDTSPGGAWPYGFSCDPAIPSAELLLAEDAAERLAAADAARVPSVAEVDELAAAYKRQTGWTPEEYARHNHSPEVPCVKLCPAFSSPPPAERLGDEWDRIHPGWRQHTGRAPVVASVTDAARWRPPAGADADTVDGVVVTPRRRRAPRLEPADDWDVLAGAAFPGYVYAPDALGGHRTVDELVDSMVRRARPS